MTHSGMKPLLRWEFYANDDTRLIEGPNESKVPDRELQVASEAIDSASLDQKMNWNYAFLKATVEPAKSSVSAMRRRMETFEAEESFPAGFVRQRGHQPSKTQGGSLTAAEAGIGHHTVLQRAPWDSLSTRLGLEQVANRLVDEGHLSPEQRQALDLDSLTDFWRSELGQLIIKQQALAHRELPFTARFTLGELAQLGAIDANGINRVGDLGSPAPDISEEFVVIQGYIDLAVILRDAIWIVDFKTDAVSPNTVADKVQMYSLQLQLYSRAMSRIYRRPVTARWLHFLALRRSIQLPLCV